MSEANWTDPGVEAITQAEVMCIYMSRGWRVMRHAVMVRIVVDGQTQSRQQLTILTAGGAAIGICADGSVITFKSKKPFCTENGVTFYGKV